VRRVHPAAYLSALEGIARLGGGTLDADTKMGPASYAAALAGAGAALDAVRHAASGRGHGFAAVRPPGHHALAAQAIGFCLLANAVIAAREAQALGRSRVLIVDWDVHHGNGTEALVRADGTVRFISLHQWPAYPGTGRAEDRGVENVFNLPRPAGLPAARYVDDLAGAFIAATEGWAPDLLLISAGYDSMRGDPLGGFTLEPRHYAELIGRFRARCPDAPIAAVLEGGNVPARLADGVLATLEAMA
jgi:acetoin utilization deacetylase AcuC-like enzyme